MDSNNSGIEHASDSPSAAKGNRIGRFNYYFDKSIHAYTQCKTKPVKFKKYKNTFTLVVRRFIDSKGQVEKIEVLIQSSGLLQVLQSINKDVLRLELHRIPPQARLEKRLEEEKAQEAPDNVLVADLETALKFTDEHHATTIIELHNLLGNGEISFDLLWALFRPNIYVYHRHDLTDQDSILYSRTMEYDRDNDGSPRVRLTCNIISRDSSRFGVSQSALSIKYFKGTKKITELEAFPLALHPERDAVSQHALMRGKRYANMKGPTYQELRKAGARESNSAIGVDLLKFNAYGRVMLDPVAFEKFEPNNRLRTRVLKMLDPDNLTDEQYKICTPIAFGFCFGTKTWGGFAMDRVENVLWDQDVFSSLVLAAKQKTLIHSLIKEHITRATSSSLFDDIVRGKGKGLIGLLSGRPGCGKTLTAEAVAEVTQRPLYMVSAGELGIRPEDLDRSLARILDLARAWNTVLLLDEAEVFIQMRKITDMKRNALVSIFLRQLEYYQGIMILTTNLIGSVDPAFESRIHFCIHYPDLDFSSRRTIWKIFLAKTSRNSKGVKEMDIDRLAEREMNGRQIKNTVSSAQSIAMEEKLPLSIEHIDTVLDVLSEWNVARVPKASLGPRVIIVVTILGLSTIAMYVAVIFTIRYNS